MVLDDEHTVHLIRRREVDDDAIGERFHTACGEQLWSDIEAPLHAALRGGWQETEDGTTSCAGCAAFAHEFPETADHPDDPGMPAAITSAFVCTVAAESRGELARQLEHLRFVQPDSAREMVADSYREWLLESLANGAHQGGEA